MEEQDQTIESSEETSGVDAPSEATQWAQDAEADGEDAGIDSDEDLADLADLDDDDDDDDAEDSGEVA